MPTTRKTIHRKPTRRITDHAVDLYDQMEALAQQCSCGSDMRRECAACEQWWRLQHELHGELKLQPWEFPACSRLDNDEPNVMARNRALKAESEARKRWRALKETTEARKQ
jgi:hypothetical protein